MWTCSLLSYIISLSHVIEAALKGNLQGVVGGSDGAEAAL